MFIVLVLAALIYIYHIFLKDCHYQQKVYNILLCLSIQYCNVAEIHWRVAKGLHPGPAGKESSPGQCHWPPDTGLQGFSARQSIVVECSALQCSTMKCNAVQYNAVQYNAVQCTLSEVQ